MPRLSVLTITYNEEKNIADCLESVRWADEVIVVDSGSNDRTVEIARCYTDKILQVEWRGYGASRNSALAVATGDWVLWLDADERVPDDLAREIAEVMRSENGRHNAYDVARRAYFLGRWIRHAGWYPSRIVRLFRRRCGTFNDSRVHEQLLIDGSVGSLQHDLIHYTDPDLRHYFDKFNRYTTLAAEDMHAAGRKFRIPDIFVRPAFIFFKMYILRLGFLDGMQGLILSAVSSAYVFTKYAKLWEIRNQ